MKIKLVSLILAIFIIVMYVPVYAESNIPPLPDGGWEYWVVAKEYGGTIIYISSHNPITVAPSITNPERMTLKLITFKLYRHDGKRWNHIAENGGKDDYRHTFESILQANHHIAYADGSGFFFLRPRVSRLTPGMKETDFGKILKSFSAGLIPILGCLISLWGFRKAWHFLRSQLQN